MDKEKQSLDVKRNRPEKSEENLLRKRLEIRRETEQLKAQLEELIKTNKNAEQSTARDKIDSSKVQVIKSQDQVYITKPRTTGVAPKETKTSIKKEALHKNTLEAANSSKKKNYNVEEAREFMRKQKEKRKELIKSEEKGEALTRELKKKKIEELRKKQLDLVTKNIQAKRERSKSRDCQNEQIRPVTDLNFASGSRQSRCTVKKNGESSNLFNKKSSPKKMQHEETKSVVLNNMAKNEEKMDQKFTLKRNANLLYPPNYTLLELKNSIDENHFDNPKTLPEEPMLNETDENVEPQNKIDVLSNITLRPPNSGEEKPSIPLWLQENPIQSDPFNFINSVKRKLQVALNPPKVSSVDVAVQSSIMDNLNIEETNEPTANIKRVSSTSTSSKSKKTDLRSFLSHKCLNLDPKTIEQLSLIPKKSSSKESVRSVTKTDSTCESESDTSKNIPSISSESYFSLNKNDNLKISTENLNNMRLKHNDIKSSTNTIIDTEKHPTNSKNSKTITQSQGKKDKSNNKIKEKIVKPYSYSSDFLTNLETTSLSKGRESIISSNCAKISPNKVTTNHISSSTHTIDTEKNHSSSETITQSEKRNDRINRQFRENSHKPSTYSSDFLSDFDRARDSILSFNSAKVSPNKVLTINSDNKTVNSSNVIEGIPDSKVISLSSEIPDLKRSNDIKKNSESKSTNSNENILTNKKISSEKSITDVSETSEKTKTIKTNSGSKRSHTFKSLYSDFHESQTDNELGSKSETCLVTQQSKSGENEILVKSVSDQNISSKPNLSSIFPLKEPKLVLKSSNENKSQDSKRSDLMKNICLRTGDQAFGEKGSNQIHLKFEAEIHLLNDFNESLKHLTEVEKAFESLKSKNDSNITTRTILQNRDTQTSVITRSSKNTVSNDSKSQISTINYSRGSDINSELSDYTCDNKSIISNNVTNSKNKTSSILSVKHLQLSNTNDETLLQSSKNNYSECFGEFENLHSKNFAGISLTMFDHLIRDEDVRLENIKTMLKIREQALLDRTKAELAMLEMHRKHLKETGNLQEASLVKKKQRGILLKHQHERHEMQRLKQMQKAASTERKIILKEQRNLIKHQLYTDNMLSKIKVNTPRERRQSGPLKVLQTHESIKSETSVSKKIAAESEVQSVTSRTTCSVLSVLSEDGRSHTETKNTSRKFESHRGGGATSHMKRTLLMREDALKKRSKEVQELLQWHNKLLEEEKRITALENTANIIISRTPNVAADPVPSDNKQTPDDKVNPMSQIALERFCKTTRDCTLKSKISSKKTSSSDVSNIQTDDSISDIGAVNLTQSIPDKQDSFIVSMVKTDTHENLPETSEVATVASNSYSLDFEVETTSDAQEMDVMNQSRSRISSISELIDNFSKIKDEISTLGIANQVTNNLDNNKVIKSCELLSRTEKTASELSSEEPSALETAKSSTELIVNDVSKHSSHSHVRSVDISVGKPTDQVSSVKLATQKSTDEDKTLESMPVITDSSGSEKTVSTTKTAENKIVASIEETPSISSRVKPSSEETLKSSSSDKKLSEIVSEETQGTKSDISKLEENIGVTSAQINDTSTEGNTTVITDKTDTQVVSEHMVQQVEQSVEEDLINVGSTIVEKLQEEYTLSTEETINHNLSNHNIQPLSEKEIHPEDTSCTPESPVKNKLNETFVENDISAIQSPTNDYTTDFSSGEEYKVESPEHKDHDTTNETQSSVTFEEIHSPSSKEDINSCEEKEHDSLSASSSASSQSAVITEKIECQEKSVGFTDNDNQQDSERSIGISEISQLVDSIEQSSEDVTKSQIFHNKKSVSDNEESSSKSKSSSTEERSPRIPIDIKARVSEILAESSPTKNNRRLQDLYVTTYDLASPVTSPNSDSKITLGSEAQEILKKQIAIEQEIKQITEQQKQLPYMYVRDIPNKPPPPYSPPSSTASRNVISIVPKKQEEIEEITKYSAKIIHKAYVSNNLENITISDNTLNLIGKNINKDCYKFVFDLCKELAIKHYKQFESEKVPPWLQVTRKPKLAVVQPLDAKGLEKYMNKNLAQLFNFQKVKIRENTIIKWSRKKRDHVDEILVLESQAEEAEWTNFDRDELEIKNKVTNDIMKMLLKESIEVVREVLSKKSNLC